MKPSPVLCARLRFTTKEVGRGFYRGNRTGSMGAHTEYGGYIIDWRKVRNYAVPDLTDFKLTPFVTQEMEPKSRLITPDDGPAHTPKYIDPMEYLRTWKRQNPAEYDQLLQYQAQDREQKAAAAAKENRDEEMDRLYFEEARAQEARAQEGKPTAQLEESATRTAQQIIRSRRRRQGSESTPTEEVTS